MSEHIGTASREEQQVADRVQSPYAMDGALFVEFYEHYKYNVPASEGWDELVPDGYDSQGIAKFRRDRHPGAGRPVYDAVDMVRIAAPGDRNSIIEKEVTPWFLERRPILAKKYQDWKGSNKSGLAAQGTPLEALPFMSKALVKSFEAVNVFTAEQLAAMPDTACQSFAGSIGMRQKARDFIDAAKAMAPIEDLRNQLDVERGKNEELAKTLKSLSARLDKAEGKGR